jgi:exodeoxyribonuclease-3
MEKVEWWLGRAKPDVLLVQETKLADHDAPVMAFSMAGYDFAHHGEGRWNGVAIAARRGIGIDGVVTNFGLGGVRDSSAGSSTAYGEDDFDPLDEARMISAICGGVRVVSIYAPNGRVVGSPFYAGKLNWYARLLQWLRESANPGEDLVIGGDFNLAPTDDDVWDAAAVHGGTHVSTAERAAFEKLLGWGLVDGYRSVRPEPGRFTWWDYRAGNFHKNFGMRIDHLLVTSSLADRIVAADIDREARKGKPIPSDHAPLFLDIDDDGVAVETGWDAAGERIAARGGLNPG